MFNQGGLSLEQAPPISVVLRFFVTGALFGTLLGIFMLMDILNIDLVNVEALFIHTLSLGVMVSFMLGALFQMLPVLAGVVITMPTRKAMIVHLLFVIGLLLQLSAFIDSFTSFLYFISGAYLASGLFYAIYLMLKELFTIKEHSNSSKGMIFALLSLGLAVIFGSYLLLSLGGYIDGAYFMQIKELHYSFALFGWVSLLIVSVSFQVIEMFYITPKYPPLMSKNFTSAIFSLLFLKIGAIAMGFETESITAFLAILFMLYGTVTLHRLYHRKRPTSDATVWFWRLGMGLLIISMTITLLDTFTYLPIEVKKVSYFSFIGFGLSIVFAMVYKIVPFLTWFHLSNQGYMEAPMMHDVIHPKQAKRHFYLHVLMLLFLIASLFFNIFILTVLNAILVLLSFGFLLYHLIYAIRKYRYTQKHSKKIEWKQG